ncbi:response regulator transcription factor [Ravibacter arvi]|uniref:Response regulator transcription factor n=1 Tax=Ravibacter arvi TaxID=2051041 RepID=A0ABP8M4I0_9BACT
MKRIEVAIVDDHAVVIDGLVAMLSSCDEIRIVYTTHNGRDLLEYLQANVPDVLLMDIQMPEIGGIELARLVLQRQPKVKIIAFSSFDDSGYVKSVMRKGAKGYLLKNSDKQTIIRAIGRVMSGEEFLDDAIKNIILQETITGRRRSIYEIPLTKREKELVKLIAEGHSSQEIADKLYISLRTVETHRLNIKQKMGVKNTAGLLKEAVKRGLID